MHFSWASLALVAAFSTTVYALEDNSLEEHGQYVVDVTDRYIVTLKPNVDVEKHMTYVQGIHKAALAKRQDGHGFEGVTHNYNITGYNGYAGHFDEAVVEQLRHHDDVDFAENDKVWTPDALIEQGNAGYGLVLISHRHIGGFPPPAPPVDPSPPRQPGKQPGKQPPKDPSRPPKDPSRPRPEDEKYVYDDSAGAGTFAYVLDSGIDVYHPYFENRAYRGYTALAPGAKMFNDTYGTGTHVAGIIGSTNFGVAKKTKMIAVKVFQRDSAQLSKIMDGYRWAVNDIVSKRRTRMGVIAVTVYGATSQAFNRAVDQAANRGILTVVCAGNDNKNVARTRESQNALTVGATDKDRKRAPFSNYGGNVDIYAPGVLIMSTIHHKDIKNPLRFQQKSGTAQAAAYVAGLAVYFKRLKSLPSAKTTKDYILKVAIQDTVATPGGGRKQPFAYNNSGR